METEIKLYKSPLRAIKLILICSAFVSLGTWGIKSHTMPAMLSWLTIGFFGLGCPVGLFHLLDRRPQVIINEIGIFDRTAHSDFINWEIIQDAYLIDIHKQTFICLRVDEQFKPSNTRGKIYRQAAKLNEYIGAQELNISLGQIRVNPEKLTEFILLMRTATKPGKNGIDKKNISW
jgi:hypothetical protein